MNNPSRGMLLLNKQPGHTSFQALAACKKAFNTKRIGHAGTLDKFAEGLLLVFVNEATRLVPFFVGLDKTYEATIQFGIETDTLDPSGAVVRAAPVPSMEIVESILPLFLGRQDQIPPAYSAIHIDGKRAYERVLAGETPELKPRNIEITELSIMEWNPPYLSVRVSCSSGTYVRSLARDIAVQAGSAGSLSALRRTRIGPFRLSETVPSSREAESDGWHNRSFLQDRKLAEVIPGLPVVNIQTDYAAHFQGGKLMSSQWFGDLPVTVTGDISVCCGNEFLGIIHSSASGLSYRLVFPKG